jgi:hypothetical protein
VSPVSIHAGGDARLAALAQPVESVDASSSAAAMGDDAFFESAPILDAARRLPQG